MFSHLVSLSSVHVCVCVKWAITLWSRLNNWTEIEEDSALLVACESGSDPCGLGSDFNIKR